MRTERASTRLQAVCLALLLAVHAAPTAAEVQRDIVFDCPCSAEWTAGAEGEPGTLTLHAGMRSYRATQSGAVVVSARWWTADAGARTGQVGAYGRTRGSWSIPLDRPGSDAVVELHLLEQTAAGPDGSARWHRHEALALWPVPRADETDPVRFVDILTDADGDGVGDVNERLAGTSPDDAAATPGETVVDVLAFYTAAFRAKEADYPYTRILHVMNVSSALFEDSGANLRLRTVGMAEVTLTDDGAPTDRRSLMDSHGADVSVQFGHVGPCSGNGCADIGASRTSRWVGGRRYDSFDADGIVGVTAHELGHVMGLAHSARQGETSGAFRWSRGHYLTPPGARAGYGTIMAYGTWFRGGVFSDPSADCGGAPCGVDIDERDGADAVRSMNLLRFQIGANRAAAADADGDGIVDVADAAPDDPDDWFDVDGDGIADNADPDDDNDGRNDTADAFPLDADEWEDADGDGIGDNADDDVTDLAPFKDPALRAAVERALDKTAGATITTEDMAGLTELRAVGRGIRDLTGLELATGLEKLVLGNNRIVDLSALSGLTSLRQLDLDRNEVADLAPLAGLSTLQRLDLSDNPVGDVGSLRALNECRQLYLDRTEVAYADIRALPYFDKFGALGLSGLGIRDLSAVSALPLWNLRLAGNPLSDLSSLSGVTSLQYLDLSDTGVTSIDALSGLTRMRGLMLGGNRVSDLSPLSAMTALTTLSLADNDISDIGALAGMVDMWWLSLAGNGVSDLTPLSAMTALTRLNLSGNNVSDVGALRAMVKMRWLSLLGNRVADLSPLSGMVALTSLDLTDNSVSDIGPLRGMVSLEWLQLDRNSVKDLSPLWGSAGLRTINLRDNGITDISPLRSHVRLETVLLGGNQVTDLSPLSAMTALRYLDLFANAVSDIGPLVDRSIYGSGGPAGALVGLWANPLDETSVDDHLPTLVSWGVYVTFGSPRSGAPTAPIPDPTLRAVVAERLAFAGVQTDDAMQRWPIGELRTLRIRGRGIATLAGMDAAEGLERIYADSNRIADLSPLAELASLKELDLRNNRISDIAPLVANSDLATGDWVALDGNPLSEDAVNVQVPALIARGVGVSIDPVALTLVAGGDPVRFNTAGYFAARLGDGIEVAASSDDASLASVAAVDGVLTFTPGTAPGTTTVTAKATDDEDDVAQLAFAVAVRGPWLVPLLPPASDDRGGLVRIVNNDERTGELRIVAIDDGGARKSPRTLAVAAGEALQFTSDDLETGNTDLGLAATGTGQGNWRLELESTLDLEVLSYIGTGTPDGYLASVHDVVPATAIGHHVPIFNPAGDTQTSRLRIVNLGAESAEAVIVGVDDSGLSPGGEVRADIAAGAALTLTAASLEEGATGLRGKLGDGEGKWRLSVTSAGNLAVMNLLESSAGRVSNLSTGPLPAGDEGLHTVPLFLSAGTAGRQGLVRVANRSAVAGTVTIQPYDDAGRRYDAATLSLGAGRAVNFNSTDLEGGNADKGLTGTTGAGTGDWRLELSSDLDIDVTAFVSTTAAFLTSMHDTVPRTGRRYDVHTFNAAGNTAQASRLRIVNPGSRPANLSIGGIDDDGASPGDTALLHVPAGAGASVTAAELEGGLYGALRGRGALGDGTGKWRLLIDSDRPVHVLNLVTTDTGHLSNLSTNPTIHAPAAPRAAAAFTMAAAPVEVEEGGSSTITVSVVDGATQDVAREIALSVAGDVEASDYTLSPATLTLAADASSASATFSAVDDALSEGAETATVTASLDGTAIGSTTLTVAASDLSSDASLEALVVFGMAGPFEPDTLSYTGSVVHDVAGVNVHAAPTDDGATVEITPPDAFEGSSVHRVALPVGETTITVLVTAEDGTERTYTVAMTRSAAPKATVSAVSAAVDEGAAAAFAVELSEAQSGWVWVTVAVAAEGVGLSGAPPTRVKVPAGLAATTLRVRTADDAVVGGGGTVTAALSAGDGYGLGTPATATVAVAEDDAAEFAVAASPTELAEGGSATVTASIANGVTFAAAQRIALAVTGDVEASDYTLSPAALALAAGASSASATFAALDDALAEAAETATVTATLGGADVGSATLTVRASDRSSDATLASLSLSGVPIGAFDPDTVAYAAAVPHDVTATMVTAVASDADATVSVAPPDADEQAPGHQVALPVGGTGIAAAVTASDGTERTYAVTVTRAAAPSATLAAVSATVDEGAAAVFEATLSAAQSKPLTVAVAVSAEGAELSAPAPASATFAAGGTAVRLTASTADDAVVAGDGTVTATLAAGDGYALGTPAAATVAVTENDAARFDVAATPAAVAEGGSATVTVSIANGVTFAAAQQIALAVAGDVAASDYTLRPSAPTLAAGASSVAATFTAAVDAETEAPETATVTATLDGELLGSATLTVSEASPPPALEVVGVPQLGATLTAVLADAAEGGGVRSGSAAGNGAAVAGAGVPTDVALQWLRDRAWIPGATGPAYVAGPEDVGAALSVRGARGGRTRRSAATIPVWGAPGNPAATPDEKELYATTMTLGSSDGLTIEVAGYMRLPNGTFGELDAAAFDLGGARRTVRLLVLRDDGVLGLATDSALRSADGLRVYWDGYRLTDFARGTGAGLTVWTAPTPQPRGEYGHYFGGASDGVRVAVSLRRERDVVAARFASAPPRHDGTRFAVGLEFGEEVADIGYAWVRDTLATASGGEVARATRVSPPSNRAWTLDVEPSAAETDVVLAVAAGLSLPDDRGVAAGSPVTVRPAHLLSVADASAAEGGTASFAVTLDAAASGTVTVAYATADGTATAGADYAAAAGTLTFAAGETAETVDVAVLDDDEAELDETFTLVLSNPSGAGLAVAEATGTATDEDAPLAEFADVPAEHDGRTPFPARLTFSEEIADVSYAWVRDTLAQAENATVARAQRASRPSNRAWDLTVAPTSAADVVLSLEAGLRLPDGRPLRTGPAATVRGPAPTKAQVDGATLTLAWPAARDGFGTPSGTDWSVRVDGVPRAVASAEVAGRAAVLVLSSPVAAGDAVEAGYVGSAMHPLADAAGVLRSAPWDGVAVANVTGAPPADDPGLPVPAAAPDLWTAPDAARRVDASGQGLADLSALARFAALERLDLSDNALAGLGGIEAHRTLRELDLSGNRIADVAPLRALHALERLDLSHNRLSDVSALAGLPALKVLVLDGNAVADAAPLAHMAGLEQLGLAGSAVADVAALQDLPRLRRLDLGGAPVADLSPLGDIASLEWLGLPVDPAAAADALGRLTGLRWIRRTPGAAPAPQPAPAPAP